MERTFAVEPSTSAFRQQGPDWNSDSNTASCTGKYLQLQIQAEFLQKHDTLFH